MEGFKDNHRNRERLHRKGTLLQKALLAAGVLLAQPGDDTHAHVDSPASIQSSEQSNLTRGSSTQERSIDTVVSSTTNIEKQHEEITPESMNELSRIAMYDTIKQGDTQHNLPILYDFLTKKDSKGTIPQDILNQVPERTFVEAALLAFEDPAEDSHIDIQSGLLYADQSLRHVSDIPFDAVKRLVIHQSSASDIKKMRFAETASTEVPTGDLIRILMLELNRRYPGLNPVELGQSVAYVARNLSFEGKQYVPSTHEIQSEVDSILSQRERYAETPLFERNVVVISHDEIWKTESGRLTPRFGTDALIQAIGKIQETGHRKNLTEKSTIEHISPFSYNSNPNSYKVSQTLLDKARFNALAALSDGENPTTFFFDGHGSGEAFYLSRGQVDASGTIVDEASTKITVADMADALEARWTIQHMMHPKDTQLNATFIFSACFMQDYIRALADELKRRNVPLPESMIVASEKGQYSFSYVQNPLGSKFIQMILTHPTVGGVVSHKQDHNDASSPGIFVPRKDNPHTLQQIGGMVLPQGTTDVA